MIAAAFHETIGRAAADVAVAVARARGLDAVVLTGGVFQNVRLTAVVEDELTRAGLHVLVHSRVPPTTAASASAKPPSPPTDLPTHQPASTDLVIRWRTNASWQVARVKDGVARRRGPCPS